MGNKTGFFSFTRIFWIGLAITCVRILYLLFNHRDLDIEESQYWTWSQELSFGYHSKPPLISWAIHLSTVLFGNNEWSVRLFSPIAYLFSAFFIYHVGKALFNQPIGFWSALTLLFLPGVSYSATIISTDPFLILFWSMALYYFIRGLQTQKIVDWIICGIAIGFGLLSKFTMLIFFLSALSYLLISQQYRSIWRKPGCYLAVLIGLLIFTPNLIWNHYHNNAAIAHVVQHNINLHGFHLHIKNLGVFLLAQSGIFGPILFIFLIIALYHYLTSPYREENKLLLCFGLPMLILVMAEASLVRANGNWAAVAYPSIIIFVIAYLYQQNYLFWLKLTNALHILIILVFFGWELGIAYNWTQPQSNNWTDFGKQVAQQRQTYPQSEFLVDNRDLWSKSIYYGKVSRNNLFVWDPHHTIDWVDNPAHLDIPLGKDFILITYFPKLKKSMVRAFQYHQQLTEINIDQRMRRRQDKIYIYRLENYLGDSAGISH